MIGSNDVCGHGLRGSRRACRAGEALFHAGDRPGPVYVVREGRIDVVLVSGTGRPVLLAVKRAGDLVGELGAILGTPRSASAVAKEPSVVEVIPADAFRAALTDHPEMVAAVVGQLARDVRAAGLDQLRRSEGTVTQRVAAGLVALAERTAEHDGVGVVTTVRVGHDDLAAWVGASREAVSRSLAELRGTGAVRTGRRRVTIPDVGALRAFADGAAV